MKLVNITPVSITIELENNNVYYSSNAFNVYLNNSLYKENVNTNVFTIFSLSPSTIYKVKVNDETLEAKTPDVSMIYEINPSNENDETKNIQNVIDNAVSDSLIRINEGTYNISSLLLKDRITLEIKKNAILLGITSEDKYPILDEYYIDKQNRRMVLGTWEGSPSVMKRSIITTIDNELINIVGEGLIDANAENSTWWINFRNKDYARPHVIYLNNSRNINIVGIKIMNSPCWTIHPFFSSHIGFYNLSIENPKMSPNTDGIDPQSCDDIKIIGVHFSVGDDCISIKSGKMEMALEYKKPSENILIRNCLMENGHGGVVLGSEMSAGIKDLTIERCLFKKTDRGLRIKTRRGRGKLAVIDDVKFDNIQMDEVLTPLVINMFYNCDPEAKVEYVWTKEKLEVDERTPFLGKFTFKNIHAINSEYCFAFFYGLPEAKIEEVNIIDSSFSFKESAGTGVPAMMQFAESYSRKAVFIRNVNRFNMINTRMLNFDGEMIDQEEINNINIGD